MAAYHASQVSVDHPCQLDLTLLMPLFQESAHSASTIRHAMEVVSQAVSFLNPGQVAVLACDEPLFAIAKKIQWNWPAMYGEQKLVVMLGGVPHRTGCIKSTGNVARREWVD